jgi:hypothetical protein
MIPRLNSGRFGRCHEGVEMARALVLALAVIVLALTTWVAAKSASKWAAPIPPSEAIYRSQYLNLH